MGQNFLPVLANGHFVQSHPWYFQSKELSSINTGRFSIDVILQAGRLANEAKALKTRRPSEKGSVGSQNDLSTLSQTIQK
jgi:hypothetical protein